MHRHLLFCAGVSLTFASLLPAQHPLISEFCADNETVLQDEDGRSSDWIEILNANASPVDLAGYHLTDDAAQLTKWTFPSRTLLPGESVIVFASGNDRTPAAGELHTNFQINDAGEYLALVAPGGAPVVQEFAPAYPRQYPDVSYGILVTAEETTLVSEGDTASVLIPASAPDLPGDWKTAGFSAPDISGQTGVGFQENPLATLGAGLLVHSTMDSADVGGGSGTDDATTAPFTIINSTGAGDATAITDNSGGTVTSGATGTIQEAINFSDAVGGNRRVTYGNAFDIGTGSYTVSLWINSRISSTATQFIASKGNRASSSNGWGIWAENNTLFLRAEYTGSNNASENLAVARAFGSGEQNSWHHVVMVIDNTAGILTGYYNGQTSGGSGSDNGWTPGGGGGDTHVFSPGRDFSNSSELYLGIRDDLQAEWQGTLDDFLVWDRALTPQEVADLFAGGLSGFTVPASGGGGGSPSAIATDIAGLMQNNNASAFLHLPFTVAGNPADFDSLNLRMRYNDGFIAYLNGTEVARRNAPAAPDWQSAATAAGEGFVDETISISGHIGALQAGANSLAVHGMNVSAGDGDFLILPGLEAQALTADPETFRYFLQPSPGELNSPGVSDPLAGVTISPASGTFTGSQTVTLSSDPLPAGAVIRYTTDGSDPDENSTEYTAPFDLSSSAEVRARIISPGEEGSFIESAHYLKLAADLQSFTSPLPVILLDNLGAGQIPNKRQGISAAGDGSGITQVPRQKAFMQIFGDGETTTGDLSTLPDIATMAGIRVRGSSSSNQPPGKQNLSVETWENLREQALNIAPFGMPSESDWILYAPYNYDRALIRNAFIYELMRRMGRYASRTQFVEVFINTDGGDLQMSDFAGFFVFMEKIKADNDRVDIDPLSSDGSTGGWMISSDRMDPRPEDGSNIPPFNFHTAGPNRILEGPYGGSSGADQGGDDIPTGYNTFFNFEEPAGYKSTQAQRDSIIAWMTDFEDTLYDTNFTDPVSGYRRFLHAGSAIDHFIIANLSRNVDDLQLSTYLYRPDTNGKLHLNPVWDYDRSMDSYDGRDNSTTGLSGHNHLWYPRFFQDVDFEQQTIDRWQELRRSVLSTSSLHTLIDAMAAEVTEPVASANFSKWNAANNTPRAGGWPAEIQHLKDWLEDRADWIDSQYPAPVEFSQNGGPVASGYQLGMTSASAGTIYYTLDGTDPRPSANDDPPPAVSAGAVAYTGEITVSQSVIVNARLLSGTEWSGPVTATFLVDTIPADATNLVVSEIMYNPAPPTPEEETLGFADKDEFEFIELRNIHPTATLDLSGVRFVESPEGVSFDFSASPVRFLPPGGSVLVVENIDAMEARYGSGLNIAGEYSGALSNGGESLTLIDFADQTIKAFEYDDQLPWPTAPDGDGFSLVLVAPASNPDHGDPANWQPGAATGGSPGGSDTVPYTGQTSLLSYALGTDASLEILAGGQLSYNVSLTSENIQVCLETSPDLENWTENTGELTLLSRSHNGSGMETFLWTLTPSSPPLFVRLKVNLVE